MKKILIFSIAYYPLVGGAEVAIKEITDRIGDIYFDMITPRFDKKPASPSQGGSLKFEKIGNVNVYRICSPKLFFPFTALITAIQLHKKSKYDAIWAVMAAYAGFAASFFKLFHPKIPYLLTLQEGDPIEYIKKKVRFVYPLFKKIFTKADYIQCISNFLADWARQMGADCPIEVVPNGVDIKQFSIFNFQFSNNFQFSISKIKSDLGIREDEKILITTSRLVKKNAIEDVIEALQYLPENVKFLVLGIGPLEIDLKFKIKNLKLDGRVIFLGYVSHEDLPRYLKISDVFVRPSLSEGLGISFLEAMAAGIPVVATPVGGIPDFLVDGKTGWFCEVNNPQSVAEKINYILDEKNKEEVNRVAANAKKMVEEKYNWDNIALKMNNIFNALKIFSKYKKELNIDNGGRLKILIATGIFPPDIGGPAKYAKNLSEEFLKRGNEVNVLAYKTEKKLPIGIRHCLYFFRVVFNLHKTDLIIALDTFSVGLPAVIAAKIFNKKIIIRTGGDFFWESYVERSGNLITLKQFYEVKPALNLKEKTIFILSKYVLKNSTAIVFSTGWQKEIFEKYYGLNHRKNYIIENYFEVKESIGQAAKEKKFLWAGRPLKLKNIKRLREAFSEAQKIRPELILNIVQDMPYEKLLEEIKKCYAVILPSLSEISPNFILDAISCRKPFILTKESGYREMFKFIGLFTDPLDKEDIKNKILLLADDKNYKEYKDKVMNFNFTHSWRRIADEFLEIYKKI